MEKQKPPFSQGKSLSEITYEINSDFQKSLVIELGKLTVFSLNHTTQPIFGTEISLSFSSLQ